VYSSTVTISHYLYQNFAQKFVKFLLPINSKEQTVDFELVQLICLTGRNNTSFLPPQTLKCILTALTNCRVLRLDPEVSETYTASIFRVTPDFSAFLYFRLQLCVNNLIPLFLPHTLPISYFISSARKWLVRCIHYDVHHYAINQCIYRYRNLRTQQMSVLNLLCTSYTICFGSYWWPSSGGIYIYIGIYTD
jgi:hypothetical protein